MNNEFAIKIHGDDNVAVNIHRINEVGLTQIL